MIISDNAPQFKLVKTVIDQQWSEIFRSEIFRSDEVLHFFSNEGITWKYTIALAPWQGGFLRTSCEFSETRIKERNWSKIVILG